MKLCKHCKANELNLPSEIAGERCTDCLDKFVRANNVQIVAECGCQSLYGTVTHMCAKHMGEMHPFTVSFTGHRPDKLGTGYSITNDKVKEYSAQLEVILREMIAEGAVKFISGGAIGFDQIAFWTVESLKKEFPHIKNYVAVPFKKQYTAWKNPKLVEWYHAMIKRADKVVYVDEFGEQQMNKYRSRAPIGEYTTSKMQVRNEFMVDYSDVVIALWDGTSGGTGNCVRYAKKADKRIVVMKPF